MILSADRVLPCTLKTCIWKAGFQWFANCNFIKAQMFNTPEAKLKTVYEQFIKYWNWAHCPATKLYSPQHSALWPNLPQAKHLTNARERWDAGPPCRPRLFFSFFLAYSTRGSTPDMGAHTVLKELTGHSLALFPPLLPLPPPPSRRTVL